MGRILVWILLAILVAAVAFIALNFWLNRNSEQEAGATMLVECTEECSQRGQCGITQDDQELTVVLGGLERPLVTEHNVYFTTGLPVSVVESTTRTLQQTNGEEFEQTFSRIEQRNNLGDIIKVGWVADWCVREVEENE